MAPQVFLGACRPPLAYEALQVDTSIATVLPCNVVVRSLDEHTTVVEAFDPDAMMGLSVTGGLMELDPTTVKPLVNRIKRAQGQLAGVLRLLEEGRDREDVGTQLAAVSKALDRAGFAIVATGLQQCLAEGDGVDSVDVKKLERHFLSLA